MHREVLEPLYFARRRPATSWSPFLPAAAASWSPSLPTSAASWSPSLTTAAASTLGTPAWSAACLLEAETTPSAMYLPLPPYLFDATRPIPLQGIR